MEVPLSGSLNSKVAASFFFFLDVYALCFVWRTPWKDPTSITSHSPPSFEPPWQFQKAVLQEVSGSRKTNVHAVHVSLLSCIHVLHIRTIIHIYFTFMLSYIKLHRATAHVAEPFDSTFKQRGRSHQDLLGVALCASSVLCHLWTVLLGRSQQTLWGSCQHLSTNTCFIAKWYWVLEVWARDPINKLSDCRLGWVSLSQFLCVTLVLQWFLSCGGTSLFSTGAPVTSGIVATSSEEVRCPK